MSADNNQGFVTRAPTMRFPGDQEAAFLEDYFQKSLLQIRFSIGLGIFLYSVFGILDYLLIPAVKEQIWFIRFAIVCPFLALSIAFTWTRLFKRVLQLALMLAAFVIGFGIIAMTRIAYAPGSYYYYAGLILVLMWVYTFSGARFIYATFTGWMIVAVYEVVTLASGSVPVTVMVSNSFFFISANIIGMLACYQIELYKRKDFWQRALLEAEEQKSKAHLQEVRSELELAKEIQNGLLPAQSFDWPGGEIVCFCHPTLEIGGDFFSYHHSDEGRFTLALGDVSGHGIPAALLMAATLSLFDTTSERPLSPCERLAQMDQELSAYTAQRHVNCAFCYVELEDCVVHVANAGGIPPFIRRVNGEVEKLDVNGFPLGHGLGAAIGYEGVQVSLSDGDLLVMVTDGVVEAVDARKEMLGFKRLGQVIAEGPNHTAQAMMDHLVNAIQAHIDPRAPQDDFTISVVRIRSED